MDILLLADSTFQFSVGAVLGLGAVAVGYGILRSTVATLKTDFINHEQDQRSDFKDVEDRIRYLERWYDQTDGAEKRARRNRHSSSDTTQTREFRSRK